jgi:hypothetical protein
MKNFIYISLYSIFYGIYENRIVYNSITLLKYLTTYGNWSIMWGLYTSICIALGMSGLDFLYYMLWFSTIEDIVFFICDWHVQQKYPYPVGNWYDKQLPLFQVFHLGKSAEFLPYFPRFYFATLSMCSVYFVSTFLRKKFSNRTECINKFINLFSCITLTPMYVLIVGSLIVPLDITYFNASIVFTISICVLYVIEILYYVFYANKTRKRSLSN